MDVVQTLKIALRALRTNKMRSFLTMLGIIIGIAAVIAMMAVGAGARHVISQQIASIGSNIILVIPGSTTSGGIRTGTGGMQTLTGDDVRAIMTECPSVESAAPTVRTSAQVVSGNLNWSTIVMGTTSELFDIREWGVVSGRSIGQQDNDGAAKVCLLGQTVAENLFGAADPVGRMVRIKKVPFVVIGVLERKGQSPQGQDQDDVIFVPLRTAQRKLSGSQFPNTIGAAMVKARSSELLNKAEEEVNSLLKQRHRITNNREPDFTTRNLSEILAVAEQSSKAMSLLLGAVASISLIVGGIGIMNIMLVSVTERTREIGIRMAIGARRNDILLQFMTEAVLLTMIGGLAGICLGAGGALVVSHLLTWPTMISLQSITIAFVFSGAIGIFFGFYPAKRAAGLNPIDALRYE
ncbi:ABC transporter permease [Geobacter sp. SVR]|uniref:ABC transporter permease n=1 Tax=Geobacter sp. SVR TaxID=2495594 RepID=UPI00143EFAD9|nr:ABC transporter permease [Geobacter sp. SVR]BCS52358.1 multidrug ABC transporter substrate-binding protein [Geobacter sp. SVR]GCF84983.1 multidrug ABC transporter substrate-binding protein [Geobacter sp. SVR]